MLKKVLFLFTILAIIVVFFFVFKFLILGGTPKQGVLKVSTNTAARVLIDNRELGKTPFEQKISAGDYTIKLIPENATDTISSWQGKVTIGANVLTYVNRDLSESELTSAGEMLSLEKITSSKAEMTVLSVPEGANVLLDDQSKGVTPISLTDLLPGDHTLLVTSPGFDPRTIKVKLTAGYKLNAAVSLALSPSQVANPQTTLDQTTAASAAATLSTTSPTPSPTGSSTVAPKATGSPTPTPTTVSKAPKKVKITDTPTGYLNVRDQASVSTGKIVAQVKPGETYVVVDSSPGWYKISYTENADGWISSQYAQATP